jgi:hypothetical protein
MDETIEFRWNAEEALKLLNRGYRIILTQDGLGDITAVAVAKGKSLDKGLRAWRDQEPPEPKGDVWTIEDAQREVYHGMNKFSGGGSSIAQALHCLTEKAVFNRLPDGKGRFYKHPDDKE